MSGHPIAAGKSSFDLVDPEKVFREMRLEPDTVFLDLASGAGNYVFAAAQFIGDEGAIYAFDLWEEGIAALRERARALGLKRVKGEVADVSARLPLPDGCADVALMATVLHDLVSDGVARGALQEAARLLRPGGRLIVIEFAKVESEPGPPAALRLSPAQVEDLVLPHGFRRQNEVEVGDPLYLLSFVRS